MTSTLTDRIYGESASVAVKAPCATVSGGVPLPLSGLAAIGGYTPSPNDRILVKDQTDPTANGIYNAAAGAWSRSGDFDGIYDAVQGTLIVVYFPNGGATMYQLVTPNPIIGTTPLNFTSFINPTSANIPTSPAEVTVGVQIVNAQLPIGNVMRYGIVPNNPAAAVANQSIIKQLCSYGINRTGWTGKVVFPNTTGSDVYYFNNYIDFRPGIFIDLQECTLNFTKAAPDGTDANSGFIMAIRDFSIENGTIVVNFNSGIGQGTAIFLGVRGADGSFFTPFYDADYFAATGYTMGNITIRNIKTVSNNPNTLSIGALGGIQNLIVDNLWMEGSGVACGFYYEFGWATDAGGILANRQTSHANNLSFRNVKATNLSPSGGGAPGVALSANGAYNVVIDGLRVIGANGACAFGFGEAYFLNPWSNNDGSGSNKRTVTIRDVVAKGLTGSSITIQGANTSTVADGFLAGVINALPVPTLYQVQSDLVGVIIDGFACNGIAGTAQNGIQIIGADRVDIRNGRIVGFFNGINMTAEATHYNIENVDVLNNASGGILVGNGFNVWGPARLNVGRITGCFIAGSTGPGISLVANVGSCLISQNRFGYSVGHDGFAETTQTNAVNVNVGFIISCQGVVCEGNYVAGVSGGSVAYSLLSSFTNSNGCMINNPQGITTMGGAWGVDGTEIAVGSQLSSATAQINTSNKYLYRRCLDTSNNKLYFAQGPNATDAWVSADAGSTITPA